MSRQLVEMFQEPLGSFSPLMQEMKDKGMFENIKFLTSNDISHHQKTIMKTY